MSQFGLFRTLITDKGLSFTSMVFGELMRMLGIRHLQSSSGASTPNGCAERTIQRALSLLKIYCDGDKDIHRVLPLVELALNTSIHFGLKITPYEIVFGREAYLLLPGRVDDFNPKFPADQLSYYTWLKQRLRDIHSAVKTNQEEMKSETKVRFDKEHKTVIPKFKVGDKVLLKEVRLQPSAKALAVSRPYRRHFYIMEKVENKNMRAAYMLADAKTGHLHRFLIGPDRLKAAETDKQILKRSYA